MHYGKIEPISNKTSYHEFKNSDELEAWGTKYYSEWSTRHKAIFNQTQLLQSSIFRNIYDPVTAYLGNKFVDINNFLRCGKVERQDDYIPILISNLLISMSSAPVVPENIILYRQVTETTIHDMIAQNKMNQIAYVDRGFMSTSLLKDTCIDNCGDSPFMLKLYVDTVFPIHSIYASLIANRSEAELLLQPLLSLQMIEYPYIDTESGKTIFECRLSNNNNS